MSYTDKCPKCGSAIRWELGTATCTRGGCFSAAKWLKTPDAQEVLQVMSHRIRELEARIETLELTVKVLESDKQTRNDALDHERKRIAELEGQYKRACHVVEVNRQAKWKAENRVADLEEMLE